MWPRWRRGLCLCVYVCVCVFSFPLPLSSWQQQCNEDREKGAICNMILSHRSHCLPPTWERDGPAVVTALPQTQLSTSRQVSATSTSILRLYIFRGVLGDKKKKVREKSGCEEKEKVKRKSPTPLTSILENSSLRLSEERGPFTFFFPSRHQTGTLSGVTKHGFL